MTSVSNSTEIDAGHVERGDKRTEGGCCRPTWECYVFVNEHSHIKWEDRENNQKAWCCLDNYWNSCTDPQRDNNFEWAAPPMCSNRGIQADPAEKSSEKRTVT